MTGLAGILAVGSVVAVGTRAYFSQQGEVKSNVFGAGELVLSLSDADGLDTEEAEAIWDISAGAPGDDVSGTLRIRNAGSIPAHHIEIEIANTVVDAASGPGSAIGTPLDTVLKITSLTYDGNSILADIEDKNDNDIADLDDLEHTLLDNLLLVDFEEHEFAMTVLFDPVLTVAEHQGDSVSTTLTVTLNQVASQ